MKKNKAVCYGITPFYFHNSQRENKKPPKWWQWVAMGQSVVFLV